MSVILTHTGRYLDLLKPEGYDFPIEEIALVLSRVPRFSGHTRLGESYCGLSVAQHCVFVSRLTGKDLALPALLHDAQEAYLGDVASPLKALLSEYRGIEGRMQDALFAAHGLPPLEGSVADIIKAIDTDVLRIERRIYMPRATEHHMRGFPPEWEPHRLWEGKLGKIWEPNKATDIFLLTYYEAMITR